MDFQPSPTVGVPVSWPLMHSHAWRGPAIGCPYSAVGMQRASDSAIGLPSSSTSASLMLAFLMPAEVRRSFMSLETDKPPRTHRCSKSSLFFNGLFKMGAVSAPGQSSRQGIDERTLRVPFPADSCRFDKLVFYACPEPGISRVLQPPSQLAS